MEMRMRASEDIEIGEDITPAIPALCFCLNDSFVSSHCSSCFSPLPSHHSSSSNPFHLLYCSPPSSCSLSSSTSSAAADSHLLLLLHSRPSLYPHGDSSDLRLALRLLHHSAPPPLSLSRDRIAGLLTNRHKLMTREASDDDEFVARIRSGARAMAAARRMRDGLDDVSCCDHAASEYDAVLEEEATALCLVITNAVEVQDKSGRTLGLALFCPSFCWINHSCSPNACYRTLLCTDPQTAPSSSVQGKKPLRISPYSCGCGDEDNQIAGVVCSNGILTKESHCYCGPRIIVRSIKRITKGEEVTVAYTDLLQPKAVRQSELWSRYRFICCCRRCSASPLTYVDRALEELSVASLDSLSSNISFDTDKATEKLTEYIEDAIADYLSSDDPVSCCKRLEHVLAQGLSDEQLECKEGNSQATYRLHPLHHLSLNAYTTLQSAYKTRTSDLLPLCPERDEHLVEAFNMSRSSVAYALMLAGATHHLFHFETSLIASVANFWISAGESLLTFARSSVWNEFVGWGLPVLNLSSITAHKCPKCLLVDKFRTIQLDSQVQYADFEDTRRKFLVCVTGFTHEVWSFLVNSCCYLRSFKDPIDFSWSANSKFSSFLEIDARSSSTDMHGCEVEEDSDSGKIRIYMFQLGMHCLLYGGYLASICFGGHSSLTCHVQNIVDGE
ncbi:protein SET DOMAIN GROUP 41 isoform X2 [Ziziphus jujuba]|uniref:Protein SET DOMAIN GROUP 41 isoform X2 n=1 Tax=Ziziphus jujuba TaxID=326968 RepID=A0A6P3ZX93_ZIZJJ|nr:protein SET DOMAIN GROUP 41 isoform X2 [Ziziphus jujuba]